MMIRLLTETGLGRGEACPLRDVDLDWRGDFATLQVTKAGKKQHIALSAEALATLRGLSPGDGYVFHWPDGRLWSESYVTHTFAKAAVERQMVPSDVAGRF